MSNTCSSSVQGTLRWQPGLFDAAAAPEVDATFARVERRDLDTEAWVDHCPGWVAGAAELFDTIVHRAPWAHRTVPMYGRMVEEPRLIAWYGTEGMDDPTFPPVVPAMASALTGRYGRTFDSVGAALYRDGRDSVAWHGDRAPRSPDAEGPSGESRATHERRIPLEIVDPIVAIVSLGSPRRLLLRPARGGRSVPFALFPGDLLVMGGRTQRTWEHSIPKVARAGPRLSLQFRHSR